MFVVKSKKLMANEWIIQLYFDKWSLMCRAFLLIWKITEVVELSLLLWLPITCSVKISYFCSHRKLFCNILLLSYSFLKHQTDSVAVCNSGQCGTVWMISSYCRWKSQWVRFDLVESVVSLTRGLYLHQSCVLSCCDCETRVFVTVNTCRSQTLIGLFAFYGPLSLDPYGNIWSPT